MFPVRQQLIERGGIGKGGVFARGGVGALFVAVGTERGGIEGNQCRAAALGAGYPFDVGVEPGQRNTTARHQAKPFGRVGRSLGLGLLPTLLNFRFLGDRVALVPENQIAALANLWPVLLQGRVFGGYSRVPAVKKGEDGPGGGTLCAVQPLPVKGRGGGETFSCTNGVVLSIRPQYVRRVAVQEVRCHTGSFFHWLRDQQLLGNQGGLFAPGYLPLQVEQSQQGSGFPQFQRPGHFCHGPAGAGDFALGQQVFIILCQSL